MVVLYGILFFVSIILGWVGLNRVYGKLDKLGLQPTLGNIFFIFFHESKQELKRKQQTEGSVAAELHGPEIHQQIRQRVSATGASWEHATKQVLLISNKEQNRRVRPVKQGIKGQ